VYTSFYVNTNVAKLLERAINNLRLRRKLELTAREWNESIRPERPTGDEDLFFTMAQLEAVDAWRQDMNLAPSEEHFLADSRQKRLSDSQREIERLQQLTEAEQAAKEEATKRANAEQLAKEEAIERKYDAIRSSQRLKRSLIGISALALVAAILGVAAWYQRSEAQQANLRNQAQLHKASMDDHARAVQAWQEDYDAERAGRWAPSIGHASKWHEAVALWTRALELDPTNALASYWLYDTLLHDGHAKANLPLKTLPHNGLVICASFSVDSARIFAVCQDGTVKVWDAASGAPLSQPLRHKDMIENVSFSPDGGRIVTVRDRIARIWDITVGSPLGNLLVHEDDVISAIFSPDGTRIVTTSVDQSVRTWDASTGAPIGNPLRHRFPVSDASFSPDGSLVVSVDGTGKAQIWDVASGSPVGQPFRAKFRARFSPEGARIATPNDQHVSIWDAATGAELRDPLQHDDFEFQPRRNADRHRQPRKSGAGLGCRHRRKDRRAPRASRRHDQREFQPGRSADRHRQP